MAAAAIAAGVLGLNNGNNRRAPNHKREGCNTTEDDYFALRLRRNETHMVAVEYVCSLEKAGGCEDPVPHCTALKRVQVFLHYLARGGYTINWVEAKVCQKAGRW